MQSATLSRVRTRCDAFEAGMHTDVILECTVVTQGGYSIQTTVVSYLACSSACPPTFNIRMPMKDLR